MSVLTKAALHSSINTEIIANGLGLITAEKMNMLLNNIVDSYNDTPPQYTATERNQLDSVTEGLIIYNTTDNRFEFYSGAAWLPLGSNTRVIDLTLNPNYPAALLGDVIIAGTTGKIGGPSGMPLLSGDVIICKQNNTGGNYATAAAYFSVLQAQSIITGSSNDSAITRNAVNDGTAVMALGFSAQAQGTNANALGYKAINRIDKTTVITGPVMVRKSDTAAADDLFLYLSGAQVVLTTGVIDLREEQSVTITIPTGVKFYADEAGLIVTGAGGVSVHPKIELGTSTDDNFLLAETTCTVGAAGSRHRYDALLTNIGVTTLKVTVTAGATADVAAGRFYFKGILVENQ